MNLTKLFENVEWLFLSAASYDVDTIFRAMNDYHYYTCLQFEPFNGHSDYIFIS